MALQSYFPNAEAERIIWLGNYQAKIATHGLTVGLTPGEIAEIQAAAYKNLIAAGEGSPPLPAITPMISQPPPAMPTIPIPTSPSPRKPALTMPWSASLTKHGHDGVWIESRRGGGNFEFLGIDQALYGRAFPARPRHRRNPRIPHALVGQGRAQRRLEPGAKRGGGSLIRRD